MSAYPTALDSAATMLNPVDKFTGKPLTTTLAVSCLSTDTTLQLSASVASSGGPATWGLIKFGDEEVIYESSSGVYLQNCHRGANGTLAVGHAISTVVTWPSSALYLTALQAIVVAIETALGVIGAWNFALASALGLVSSITLTGTTTEITSPQTPVGGQSLTVIITQDGTGGRQITWSSAFQATVVDIDTTASTVSIFRFTGSGGKWVLDSYRTGVTL